MKTSTGTLLILPALLAGLGLITAGRATAQNFTNLHSFSATDPVTGTNSDGAHPQAKLISSGNTLYGTAYYGGTSSNGTVFAIKTDGTGFRNLHSFSATDPMTGTNSDGAFPIAALILSGNTLYGAAELGGIEGSGTLFKINTDGASFTTLYSFTALPVFAPLTNSDGWDPDATLVLSGNTLYGTAFKGGTNGTGTVFSVTTNGTAFAILYTFSAIPASPPYTNSDGAWPAGGLLLSGNTLYGMANTGGTSGNGTLFALKTNGTGFTTLHDFSATDPVTGTNSDGAVPFCSLALSGNTLYGTASKGGSSGSGTVFAISTNGANFTTLHSFTAIPGIAPYTNSDGFGPQAGLILSGRILYGTAAVGGNPADGTVFAVSTNGAAFATLYNFSALDAVTGTNSDGADLIPGLILSGNTLYGTAYLGGTSSNGTVFSLSAIYLQFMANLTNGALPFAVNFTSPGVDNYGNAITGWNWNFGDGSTSAARNPSHTYTVAGNYSPTLVATNTNGLPISASGPSITVPPPPPTIAFSANPTIGLAPLTVSFTAAGVDSAGNAISGWNWTFGDGTNSTAQNPSHTYTTNGTFFPALLAINSLGATAAGIGPVSITATNAPANSGLVLNGGFETGDFTGWTVSGAVSNAIDIFVDNGSQSEINPHSGGYLAALGPIGSLSYLSQTLPTSAGAAYFLSFQLDSPDGQTPNEFLVSWNGSTLFDETNIPAIGWTNLQFLVSATGTNTVLEFGFRNDPGYLGLDDISLVPAQPGIASISLSGTNLVLNGINGLSGGTYYVLTSPDLTLPLSQWMRVATNVLGAGGNFTITATNSVTSGASQQFYILQLQ